MKRAVANPYRIADVPNDVLWSYNAQDVEQTWVAAKHLHRDMKLLDVRETHDRMLRIALPAHRMQERGLLVDPERRKALFDHVKQALALREQMMLDCFQQQCGDELKAALAFGGWLRRFGNPRRRATLKLKPLNPRSRIHMGTLLKAFGMQWKFYPKLDLDVVGQLRRQYPQHETILAAIWEYKKLEKLRADWLEDGKKAKLLCRDSRLRGSVRVTGTQSGRFSVSGRDWCNPCQDANHGRNWQNLPKTDDEFCKEHAPIRTMIIAEPGKVLIEADYSQLEAEIAARLSGDKAFIAKLASPDGVHIENARDLFGLKPGEPVTSLQKRLAKIFLYGGVLYMGGPGTIQMSYEKAGIFLPQAKIATWQARWKLRQQTFVHWQQRVIQDAMRERPYRARTAWGRQRLFWGLPDSWGKDCIAHKISGTGADYVNEAMIELDAAGYEILAHFHDALLLSCDVADLDATAQALRKSMEREGPIGRFRVDVKFTDTNLAELRPWPSA